MTHGWVFLQWISPRLFPSLPPKQHVNKQCSSKSAGAGRSTLGTIWLSETQLCLDTTTLICRLALKVVQWPPFPFLPSSPSAVCERERERGRERERKRERDMTWCLPPAMLQLLFPGPQLPLAAASFSGSGICWPWPLGGLSLDVAKVR